MKFAGKTVVLLVLIGMLLASCAPAVAGEPTVDINASLTAGVGTVIANFFETQTALAPPASETPSITPLPLQTSSPVALPTLASFASATPYIVYASPTPTGTYYTATPNPSSLAYGCNNLAFLSDVSVPSGTVMKPGQSFTKEWKVANTGTCLWKWAYKVVNVSGNAMGGSATHPNDSIPVGKWTTLRVAMTAPTTPGTYTGYWQLSDEAGHKFGSILGVSIVVTAPTNTPKPATATNTATSTSTVPPTVPVTQPPATQPTIASISPNTATVGSTTENVTITGSGFVNGAVVTFEGGTGTAPQVTASNVSSATTISITVTVASGAAGAWNVRVTNPDTATSVLSGAFTVQ